MAITQPRLRLSGGQFNQIANQSLGGQMSLAIASGVGTQKLVWTTTAMTGVTLCEGQGVALGAATLSYNPGTGALELEDSATNTFATILGSDGFYAVGDVSNYFVVHVLTSLLPTSGLTERDVTVLLFKNAIFDDVTNSERSTGDVEYRHLYLANENYEATLWNPSVQIADPTLGDMRIAKDISLSGTSGTMTPQGFYRTWWSSQLVYTFMTAAYKETPNPELGEVPLSPIPWVANHEGPARDQDSDGDRQDVPPFAGDEQGITGATGNLTFTTVIKWNRIDPGNCVSFWLRRTIPSASTGSLINDVSNLTFIYAP